MIRENQRRIGEFVRFNNYEMIGVVDSGFLALYVMIGTLQETAYLNIMMPGSKV